MDLCIGGKRKLTDSGWKQVRDVCCIEEVRERQSVHGNRAQARKDGDARERAFWPIVFIFLEMEIADELSDLWVLLNGHVEHEWIQ